MQIYKHFLFRKNFTEKFWQIIHYELRRFSLISLQKVYGLIPFDKPKFVLGHKTEAEGISSVDKEAATDYNRAGINPAEGRPLSFDTDFTSVIDIIMVWSRDLIFTQRHAI